MEYMNIKYYRLRIGLDGRLLLRNLRGIAVYIYNVLEHILQHDNRNQYIIYVNESSPYNISKKIYKKTLDSLTRYPNCKVININAPNQFLWEQFYLPKRIRKDKLDILHMGANRAPLYCPCRLIVTIHDMIEILYFEHFFRTLSGLRGRCYDYRVGMYIKFLYYHIFKKADLIITVSHNSANDIHRMSAIPLSKIKVIYLGYDKKLYRNRSIGKEDYLMALGGMGHKNTSAIIKAFIRLPKRLREKYKLRIIGITPHIKKLVEEISEPNIILQDSDFSVPLTELYSKSLGLVYVSLYEGFGIPPIEAMACGTPVIASNRGSVPEITANSTLSVNPDDIDAISHAMEKILTNKSLRNNLIEAGLDRVQQFSWEKCAEQHLAIYNSFKKKAIQ